MDPLPGRPAARLETAVAHLESTRELLLRMDPEFFQDTLRHLDTILRVLRIRRAVEANAARNASVT